MPVDRKWCYNFSCVSLIRSRHIPMPMHSDLLFERIHGISCKCHVFQILLDIIHQYQHQTAHNLLFSHTLLCFYFNDLSIADRQLFAYFILRVSSSPVDERQTVRVCSSHCSRSSSHATSIRRWSNDPHASNAQVPYRH